MAALEAVILYIQLTLGIANPTDAQIQQVSYELNGTTTTTIVADSPTTCDNGTAGWDINEGN